MGLVEIRISWTSEYNCFLCSKLHFTSISKPHLRKQRYLILLLVGIHTSGCFFTCESLAWRIKTKTFTLHLEEAAAAGMPSSEIHYGYGPPVHHYSGTAVPKPGQTMLIQTIPNPTSVHHSIRSHRRKRTTKKGEQPTREISSFTICFRWPPHALEKQYSFRFRAVHNGLRVGRVLFQEVRLPQVCEWATKSSR